MEKMDQRFLSVKNGDDDMKKMKIMKIMKKMLASLMVFSMVLSFTGCNEDPFRFEDSIDEKGSYSEELIMTLYNDTNHSNFYDTSNGKELYLWQDGMKYMVSEDGNIKRATDRMYTLSGFDPIGVITGRDNVFFVAVVDTYTGKNLYATIINETITFPDFSMIYAPYDEIDYKNIIRYAVISKDLKKLYFIYKDTLYVMDSCNTVTAVSKVGEYVTGMYILGDYMYVVTYDKGVLVYDASGREKTDYPEALKSFFDIVDKSEYLYMTEDKNGMYYFLCSDGVFTYKDKQNHVEQIIDSKKYKLGSQKNKAVSFCVPGNGVLVILFENGELRKYRFDCEIDNAVTSSLKIVNLSGNRMPDQYVNDFSIENQNIQVDYQKSFSEEKNGLKNDLISYLKGPDAPDIVFLDGINIDELRENDLLLDLSEYEESWSADEPLLDNVVKWNRSEKGLYSVSSYFSFPAIGGKSEQINKIKDFYSLSDEAQKYFDKNDGAETLTGFEGIEPLTGVISDGTQIFKRKDPDRAEIEKYYEACLKTARINSENKWKSLGCATFNNSLYNMQFMPKEKEDVFFAQSFNDLTEHIKPYSFAFRFLDSACLELSDPDGDKGSFTVGMINSIENELMMTASVDKNKDKTSVTFRYGINPDKKTFIPEGNIGICKNGKNQKEALRFIKSVLENENQKNITDGLSVNTETLKWYYEKNKDKDPKKIYYKNESSERTVLRFVSLDSDQIAEFEKYVRSLDEPVYLENDKIICIYCEISLILEDKKTVSEAAEDTVKFLKDPTNRADMYSSFSYVDMEID